MDRYSSYQDFRDKNAANLDLVIQARSKLKSMTELAMSGQALAEADALAYEYLNLDALVTDLLFGLSASVLDAKANVKKLEGIFFRVSSKSAADKAKLVQEDPDYLAATQFFNELTDLEDYLRNKKKDFEKAYYHYRGIANKT